MKLLKNIGLLVTAFAVSLFGSTLIRLSQIQAPAAGLISSDGANLGVTAVGAGLSLTGGVLSSSSGVPIPSVTNVTSSTPNAYPIAAGKTTPIVFRNGLVQSATVDFNITSGNVIFIFPPLVGDVILIESF